jgi:hypothetical protein
MPINSEKVMPNRGSRSYRPLQRMRDLLGRTRWQMAQQFGKSHYLAYRRLTRFYRIGAVVNLKVEDYYPSGKRFFASLQGEGRQRKGAPRPPQTGRLAFIEKSSEY